MSIENWNSMPSEAREIFLKILLLFECKKVQFGPQNIIWGLKNGGRGARPPGSATGYKYDYSCWESSSVNCYDKWLNSHILSHITQFCRVVARITVTSNFLLAKCNHLQFPYSWVLMFQRTFWTMTIMLYLGTCSFRYGIRITCFPTIMVFWFVFILYSYIQKDQCKLLILKIGQWQPHAIRSLAKSPEPIR